MKFITVIGHEPSRYLRRRIMLDLDKVEYFYPLDVEEDTIDFGAESTNIAAVTTSGAVIEFEMEHETENRKKTYIEFTDYISRLESEIPTMAVKASGFGFRVSMRH